MDQSDHVVRTPETRFADLPNFDFAFAAVDIPDAALGPLRMSYVDEGPRSAPVVLMLHGEPTWSFLYRKLIGPIAAAGYRAVVPDHIGFGRSDKPLDRSAYTYDAHVAWVRHVVERLNLQRITLVGQDWGGPIGLRVLSECPERFSGVVAANTLLPNFESPPRGIADWPGEGILAWSQSTKSLTDMAVSEAIAGACAVQPPNEILRAYDAPFPELRYKAGALEFPAIIPVRAEMPGVAENRRAWSCLDQFEKPFLTVFSDGDPFTRPWAQVFQVRVPGARGQPHEELSGAGHFLQEEQGERMAEIVLAHLHRVYGTS